MSPKLVSNQIIPHFTLSDALHALGQIRYLGKDKNEDFAEFFGTKKYQLTNTARTALGLLIKKLNLPKDKKIALPAFCCAVMATPFLTAGYAIEWIDTDHNGLIDPEDFEKKLKNVGLVIVPHIFGQLAPVQKIYSIASAKNIFVLEDCAHAFPPNKEQFQADARLYSFGREKVLSCISGGAITWPNNSPIRKLKNIKLPQPTKAWTLRHLIQPIIFALSLPWWHWGGKFISWIFRKIKLLPLAVTPSEKKGQEDIPHAALAYPLQRILKRQIKLHSTRQEHAKKLILMWKAPLKHILPEGKIIIPENNFRMIAKLTKNNRALWLKKFKKYGFHLNDWDGVPISPSGVDLKIFGYLSGQCPKAEKFAQNYLTFPTNIRISTEDIKRLAQLGKWRLSK
jgi:dTDP-4-amino-4,6-dideoxygalactose transaminase